MADRTDDFNRADGGLGANWTTLTGASAPTIASNVVKGTNGGGDSAAYYSAATWNPTHRSDITAAAVATNLGPAVRMNHGYSFYAYWGNDGIVYKFSSGSYTNLGTRSTYAVGDTAGLAVSGTTLTPYKNGSALSTVTDGTLSDGAPGIGFFGNADGLDNWEGTGESGGGGGGGGQPAIRRFGLTKYIGSPAPRGVQGVAIMQDTRRAA